MTKQIEIGRLAYEHEKTNPETGWVMVKNQNATSFWIPEELVKEVEHIQNGVGRVQDLNERLRDSVSELKKKVESQRKSIAYYKGERDAIHHTLNRHNVDAYAEREKAAIEIVQLRNKIDKLEFKLIDKSEELEMFKTRASVKLVVVSFVLCLALALVIFF